jgi:hypothetical protein
MTAKPDFSTYCLRDTQFESLLHLSGLKPTQQNLSDSQIAALENIKIYLPKTARLLPLIAKNLKQFNNCNSLSASTQKILQVSTRNAGAMVMAHKHQFLKINALFSKANIPFILLKGSAFINYLYTNEAPRTFNDLDILLHSDNWDDAVSLLEKEMNYSEKKVTGQFEDLYEVSYQPKENTGYHLDLHKSLVHPFLFNINETLLWRNTIAHPDYKNENIRILTPELNILHLAIHAYKDMDFYKYNLIDCHKIIDSQKIDWLSLLNLAKKWGCYTPLFCYLQNCKQIIGTSIPNHVLIECKPNGITRRLATYLLTSPHRQPSGGIKTFKYRVNQFLAQFVFTGSFLRPLRLQFSFLSSLVGLK